MDASFHSLTVRSVRPETADAVLVTFDVPEALRSHYAFAQGQYLTLRRQIAGADLRRPYSICSGVDDGELRVGVRRVADGAFSTWVHQHLRAGDTLDVMVPQGRFFVPLDAAARRHHLGIAAGSGITPILSILKSVLAREPLSTFTLLYANRRLASVMFKEELEDLKDHYTSRLVLHHVFSGEPMDSPLNMGRIDRAKLDEFLGTIIAARNIAHAYICGPYSMNEEAQAALLAAGVPEERVHVERFGVAAQEAARRAPTPQSASTSSRATITIVRDGLRRELACSVADATVLESAAAAGMELPFSCTSGVCGTCRARVLEGEVRMERNFALDKREVAAGFVLTCQARAVTERVVVSFDER